MVPGSPMIAASSHPRLSAIAIPLSARRLRRLGLTLALVAFGLCSGLSSKAAAYEDTIQLGVSAGYAFQLDAEEGAKRHGLDLSALADFGLNDAWSLRAFAQHQLIFPSAPLRKTALLFEAAYALDILRVVPVFGVGIGAAMEARRVEGAASEGKNERAFMPAASAFVSIDILLGRWGVIAPEIRFLATPFTGFDDTASLSLSAGIRFAYLWDRF